MEIPKNSLSIKKYKHQMIKQMKQMNPKWNESDIENIIDEMLTERLQNPTVELDNNYKGVTQESTLLSVFDWALNRSPAPIIAGNGTFYMNQFEAFNPIANMLQGFLKQRKAIKNQMFMIENTESDEYKSKDRDQGNEKVNANSYYGGSGAKSSAFYSKWSGPATTLSAQSVISTTENTFEAIIGDNYQFIDSTELTFWMQKVLKEEDWKKDDFVVQVSLDDVLNRLLSKILNRKEGDYNYVKTFLETLDDEQLCHLYYKNNLITFIRTHRKIQDLIVKIYEDVATIDEIPKCDKWLDYIPKKYRDQFDETSKYSDWKRVYQVESFMNPNVVPESIKKPLQKLTDYFMKYIYTKYMPFDRIYRLRNFKRNVVTVIDTDSNILSLDTLMRFTIDEVLRNQKFGRDDNKNTFIGVNLYTYFITTAVTDILLYYGKKSNVPEEYRHYLNMKNEFFFSKLVIGTTKKRYVSKVLLREGNFMNPPKTDVKGFDFKKATCSEYAEKVYMDLIQKHIIESDHIELKEIWEGLHKFEKQIKDSILNQEIFFLPNASAKEIGAYKDASSEQSVRGVLAWNILNPDNLIDLPSKVSLVKLNIFKEQDLEPLKESEPEIYNTIIGKIFNDKTGMFVKKSWVSTGIDYVSTSDKDWLNKIPKKYKSKYKTLGPMAWNEFVDDYESDNNTGEKGHWEYKKRGLQVLAIPSNGKIPKWALPFIDYSTMIDNIIAPFAPVLDIFNSQFVSVGKSYNGVNRKTNKFSNIVKF